MASNLSSPQFLSLTSVEADRRCYWGSSVLIPELQNSPLPAATGPGLEKGRQRKAVWRCSHLGKAPKEGKEVDSQGMGGFLEQSPAGQGFGLCERRGVRAAELCRQT